MQKGLYISTKTLGMRVSRAHVPSASRFQVVCAAKAPKRKGSKQSIFVSTASAAMVSFVTATVMPFVLPPPAFALETISVTEATQKAKPLPQQEIDKSKIWIFLTVGAMGLFIATSTLENNENFFPAITRANKAMKKTKEIQEREEAMARVQDAQLESSISAGLSKAKERALSSTAATTSAPLAPLPQPAAPPRSNVPPTLSADDSKNSGPGAGVEAAQTPQLSESLEDIRRLEEELAKRKQNAV